MSQNLQDSNGITAAFSSGGLAIGSTPSGLSTAAAITFAINGRLFSRAALATQALVLEPGTSANPLTPNVFMTLPAGKVCTFAVLVSSAGAVTVAQGDFVDVGQLAPVASNFNSDKCIVGVIKVSNVTNPFIPGTTALNAAGVTSTYTNLSQHPGTSI